MPGSTRGLPRGAGGSGGNKQHVPPGPPGWGAPQSPRVPPSVSQPAHPTRGDPKSDTGSASPPETSLLKSRLSRSGRGAGSGTPTRVSGLLAGDLPVLCGPRGLARCPPTGLPTPRQTGTRPHRHGGLPPHPARPDDTEAKLGRPPLGRGPGWLWVLSHVAEITLLGPPASHSPRNSATESVGDETAHVLTPQTQVSPRAGLTRRDGG